MSVTGLNEYIGTNGKGVFTQTGGTNATGGVTIGAASPANGTYNLNGGLIQVNSIYLVGNAAFKFTGGTIQGVNISGNEPTVAAIITVGTAASNVATVDANGNTFVLNSGGAFSGSGQLAVIDSVGGGTIVLGNTGVLVSQHLHRWHAGPIWNTGNACFPSHAQHGRTDRRQPGIDRVEHSGGTLFENNATGQAVVTAAVVGTESSSPELNVSVSPVYALATGVGLAPSAGGPVPVPEPGTLAMLGAGILLMALSRWRRITG